MLRKNGMQNYLTTYIKLYKALGGGWVSESDKEDNSNSTETK